MTDSTFDLGDHLIIWIRTHTERLYLARQLKAKCAQAFECRVDILNTGPRSRQYSCLFALEAMARVDCLRTPYVLILEDDMDFDNDSAKYALSRSISREDEHLWMTVDPTSRVLECALDCGDYGYLLTAADHIYYSGAVLLQKTRLKEFLEEYARTCSSLEFRNIDIVLSRHLLRCCGHLHIQVGYFWTARHAPESSVSSSEPGRKPVNLAGLERVVEGSSTDEKGDTDGYSVRRT